MKKKLFKTAIFTFMMGSMFAQTETIVLPRESSWKYLDDGSDQGSAWTATTFNDASWAAGNGILGYGDGQTTIVGYGSSSSAKYPTTYFRKEVTLTALPAANEDFVLRLLRDDGAIVYINGVEVFRVNLANGPISYTDLSNINVNGTSEDTYYEDIIPSSALVLGTNVISVEIHQDAITSSDISFDMELVYLTVPPLVPPVQCVLGADTTHISRFTSVMPSAQPDSLRIPATHTFQMIIQSGTPYTDTTHGETKGLFDFTGYVAKQGSSHNGYLSINHELGSFPSAGVSMLDINFDSTALVWNVTNNLPVDFTDVNGTGRNCSGGVTPWGTIITAEETLPTIDANGDGFQDIGWLVEIDPVTAEVVDHNNDGTGDKLWRMGRMSHENVVIAADNKTAYYGNDQNPGFIFKFVADEEMKMGEGSLFVLKLDGPLDATTSGSWIGIPNYTPTDCNNSTAYASSVGATNFFNVEDVEISPIDGRIYFTSKSSSRVYRFKDEGNGVSGLHVFVGNTASEYVLDTDNGLVSELWGGGMDNLTFDNEGNLYCIQDGGRNHIWMVPACHTQMNPSVKLFAVTPAGCEPTGMTFSPDYRFMFVSMQHPSSSNTTVQIDATGTPVVFNKESAIVIARKEYLGPDALPLLPISTANLEEKGPASISTLVYPNPTDGIFTLAINSSVHAQAVIRVTDIMGTNVRLISKTLQAGENKLNIDLMNLPAGVYNTTIVVDGQTINKRIVKY